MMKESMYGHVLVPGWICALIFSGCAACSPLTASKDCGTEGVSVAGRMAGSTTLRVVNWNTETFFDSVRTGDEYSEFLKSKTWGKDAYIERLKRLCATIQSLDADVVVMEELENEGVMYDISNFLAGEWDQRKIYAYGCYAKDTGSSIGCGVISRYPLSNMTVHALDVEGEGEQMPEMRPLIEVTVAKGHGTLVLFVNHWKSRSDGAEMTEKWRDWQEAVLASRMEHCVAEGSAVLACGDFNRDVGAFQSGAATGEPCGNTLVVLRRNHSGKEGLAVASPWYDAEGALVEPGSYYFNGSWERIDHFFIAGNAAFTSFAPETNGPWCDAATHVPSRYELWSGHGYSDHLPLSCTVRF